MTTTLSSTPALAVRLRLAVTRTARRLRQEAGGALSPSLSAALATVARHGPITPSDLAVREHVQRPTATRIVGRLEDAGLIVREADPDDGRSCLLDATDEGRALLAELRGRKEAFLARRLRALPAEDRAALERAAELLERLLEEEA